MSLQNQSDSTIVFLRNQSDNATALVNSLESELYDHDTLITQLNTELQWDHAVSNMKLPSDSQYLSMLPVANQAANVTKIYINSTVVGYDYAPGYPFNTPWFNGTSGGYFSSQRAFELTGNRSIYLSFWGWNRFLGPDYNGVEGRGGSPYLIIGVTLRNDYGVGEAAVGASEFGNASQVHLSIRLISQNGSIIPAQPATDISANRGDYGFVLKSDETTPIVFYLMPASVDVDHYEIYVSSLTAYLPYQS